MTPYSLKIFFLFFRACVVFQNEVKQKRPVLDNADKSQLLIMMSF